MHHRIVLRKYKASYEKEWVSPIELSYKFESALDEWNHRLYTIWQHQKDWIVCLELEDWKGAAKYSSETRAFYKGYPKWIKDAVINEGTFQNVEKNFYYKIDA